ncbi:DUF6114 domain-containing protein [Actinokineospora soli]|uniref:DUF6114 domain-containing protein n=1 Tax=Actinokineospora soli TaxID=1048753 RepID=A0ABW2TN79_9PSEU
MGFIARAWAAFTQWRRTRPFWGGVFLLAGAVPIFVLPLAPIGLVIASGIAGVSGLLIGAIMAVLALSMWFTPQTRVLAGVLGVLVALGAFPLTNLGGLFVGSVLGVIGGAMGASWAPRKVEVASAETEPAAA